MLLVVEEEVLELELLEVAGAVVVEEEVLELELLTGSSVVVVDAGTTQIISRRGGSSAST